MNKYRFLIFPLIVFAAFSCKNFQTMELTDDNQIALEEPLEKGIPANKYKGGKLFTFEDGINKWWVANSKLSIEKVGDSLKVQMKDCGLKYECWGTELDELLDFSEAEVLKVTARATGSNTPALGISLKDANGNDTSLDRPTNKIEIGDEYVEYYYNYNKKWTHWEGKRPVDASGIVEVLFFVNPGQMNWTGTIFIDDIEVITLAEMPSPEEIKKLRKERRDAKRKAQQVEAPQEKSSTEPEQKTESNTEISSENKSEVKPEPIEEVVRVESSTVSENVADVATSVVITEKAATNIIDDFSGDIKSWWKSSDSKIGFNKGEGMLTVKLNGVGPVFESFGKNFSKIDFTKTPVVKVRLKNDGQIPGDLRVDLKDVSGFVTNSKPNAKVFSTGTDFVDYYFDFTDKFYQNFPNVQTVNPENIIEIVFYVNPGGKAFNGDLIIKEISTLSLENYNKIK